LVRLAPTAEQVQRARTRAIEQRLVRLISALPEVERTEVDIDQPLPLDQPLDRPARGPRAAVVIGVMSERSPGQRRDAIERIVSAVLPDLSRDDLTVIERTPAPLRSAPEAATSAHSLVQIGPFLVHPQSAPALRGGLATLLASNALLAGILLWRTRLMRARTARRTES
jgi:type III secretory pathway lipoprotein EscJ